MAQVNAVEHANREMQRPGRKRRVFQSIDLCRKTNHHLLDGKKPLPPAYKAMLGTASRGAIKRRSISGSVIA